MNGSNLMPHSAQTVALVNCLGATTQRRSAQHRKPMSSRVVERATDSLVLEQRRSEVGPDWKLAPRARQRSVAPVSALHELSHSQTFPQRSKRVGKPPSQP